eukprot:TRINITY_DN65921_c0_g1_i1.p1 TRINITY_DN65921_c0_g1~~TRINITY_DN65921_c0_g1_i1.p1  ORF type:complete len:256 (+),score=118.86 TRINITY_DN65921_c0_g1_i1:73-840(+)
MATPFADRKHGDTIVLFDVDGTLTVPRNKAEPEMFEVLAELRKDYVVGMVGGSDLKKQNEQLGAGFQKHFDYVFAENGLHAFKHGQEFHRQNLVHHLGEAKLQKFTKAALRMVADLDIPVMRGTFFELRTGMANISPIGRNCSQEERDAFEQFDLSSGIRKKMIEELKKQFGAGTDHNLTFSIGGQISFDAFPIGWDKTYCLQFLEEFKTVHFFGDKTFEGGNDWEIYSSERTEGHSVKTYQDTIAFLRENLIGK